MAEPVALSEAAAVGVPAAEAVAEAAAEGVPDEEPVAVRAAVALRRALALAAGEPLVVARPEPLAAALGVAALERVDVADAVAEGVQEGSAEEPAAQLGVHTHGVHVELEAAPSAGEKVPAGHRVGLTEDSGQ